MEECYLPHPRF